MLNIEREFQVLLTILWSQDSLYPGNELFEAVQSKSCVLPDTTS